MKKLQIEYQIEKLSLLFEVGSIPWNNAEFTFNEDSTAHLKIYANDIEPEQIMQTWKKLEDRGQSFQIAMKYLWNRSIIFNKNNYVTYYFDDQPVSLRNQDEIECWIKYWRGEIQYSPLCLSATAPMPTCSGSFSSLPVPLPKIMPFIPPEFHTKAANLIVAEEVADYPDLQLKLAYILLEDLLDKNELENDDMKFARDFVSHPSCGSKGLVSFIIRELPSAKIDDKTVRFYRDKSDHIAFVFKYANLTLQKAKVLFNAEVEKCGGCIRY
jgi:hypothetical protein